MKTVKQLQEERAPIGAEIRRMADSLTGQKTEFSAEERSKWDALNADFSKLSLQIETRRQADHVDEVFDAPSRENIPGNEDYRPGDWERRRSERTPQSEYGSDESRSLALQAWCLRQHGYEITQQHRSACKRVGLNPNKRMLEIRLARRPGVESRAMSAQNPALGGFTIAESFSRKLEKALKDFSGPREVADVMRTENGATMPWPVNNDTDNEGEMIGENTQVGEQDLTIGTVNFQSWKFSSKLVKVPSELMEDSAFDLADYLAQALGERLGRGQNRKFTNGLGVSEPQGVVTGSKLGKQAASGTAITADEIIDLIHSVDPAYRRDPSFRLMFHDKILAVIRKLKDMNNRYLFEEGQDGAPDKIKGVRYVINQNMDDTIASGKKTMLAGAFSKFKIRDVGVLRLKKMEERYAEFDQVGFVGFMRSDSKVLDAGTGPIRHLLQP